MKTGEQFPYSVLKIKMIQHVWVIINIKQYLTRCFFFFFKSIALNYTIKVEKITMAKKIF